MLQENETSPVTINDASLIPVLICAALSVFFVNTGFFSFFFLAPLGFAAFVYNSFWFVVIVSSLANIAIAFTRFGFEGIGLNSIYPIILSICFLWIMTGKYYNIRTVYRFIISSAAACLYIMFFLFSSRYEQPIFALVNAQADLLASLNSAFTPESLYEMFKNIALKGGAITSAFFQFYLNYFVVFTFIRLFKKQGYRRPLSAFFVPANAIWVFLCALITVLITRYFQMQILDIIAWNILIVCGILFMTQGIGIIMFLLSRKSAGFRMACNFLFVILMFSPLNTFALAGILILGIAEMWMPLRLKGQVSTPEA